jgi:predicted TIM-barrel fold metal-dependent hydrolase
MNATMDKLDVMCHVGFDALQEVGSSVEDVCAVLERFKVTHAVLSPIGDGWIHKFRERNRELAQIASTHDGQFIFFCTVNPWFGKEALQELEYCFTHLDAKGVTFHPAQQGFSIDAPMIFPFIEAAQAFQRPVYFFTGIPLYGLPFNLANLARKFPRARFILGTMGASDYWGDVIPSMRLADNIWMDTSLNSNVPAVLPSFVREFGPDRVLFGSNYPYSCYRVECEKILLCHFDEETNRKIFALNARQLLGMG